MNTSMRLIAWTAHQGHVKMSLAKMFCKLLEADTSHAVGWTCTPSPDFVKVSTAFYSNRAKKFYYFVLICPSEYDWGWHLFAVSVFWWLNRWNFSSPGRLCCYKSVQSYSLSSQDKVGLWFAHTYLNIKFYLMGQRHFPHPISFFLKADRSWQPSSPGACTSHSTWFAQQHDFPFLLSLLSLVTSKLGQNTHALFNQSCLKLLVLEFSPKQLIQLV